MLSFTWSVCEGPPCLALPGVYVRGPVLSFTWSVCEGPPCLALPGVYVRGLCA